MAETSFDLIVVGGGPGGYVAAIRAAQLGMKAAVVERENLGGICLNWGCIPTKALLRTAEVAHLIAHAADFGLRLKGTVEPDLAAIVKRSRDVAGQLSKGVGFLLKKHKVAVFDGEGQLAGTAGALRKLSVTKGGKPVADLTAKHVVLATGARARALPGLEPDGKLIWTYREAMVPQTMPKSLLVVGSGAIGVEFASFYRALGVEVTIVEFLPRIVPNEDPEISKELARAFERRGFQLLAGHKLTSAKNAGDRVEMTVEPSAGGEARALTADLLLVAVGVAANTENLGLEAHGVALDRGFIKVDAENRCGDGLWAIGDVIGRGLAHVASAEGVFVAEKIAGVHAPEVHYDAIPACTYCHPEIASVGLTEETARAQNIPIKVGRMPFRALAKATAAGDPNGFVKVIWHAETGALVGAHMIGPAVTDLIAEFTLAKTTEVNAESLAYTIHAHPTFAEALRIATEDALGHAVDL
jgi:dihydrolipoamide dehydrogenase